MTMQQAGPSQRLDQLQAQAQRQAQVEEEVRQAMLDDNRTEPLSSNEQPIVQGEISKWF